MKFLSEFKWTKGSGRDKDGNVLAEEITEEIING